MPTKTNILKKKLIKAMLKNLGIVTASCSDVGVNRSTYYDYYNNDEEFKKEVDDIQNVALDFAESALHKNIKEGKETSTIFYLKTKGKKRGYVEKTQHEHSGSIQTFDKIYIEKPLDDE